MKKLTGTAGTIVAPLEPHEAAAADDAKSGEVTQAEASPQTRKKHQLNARPFRPPSAEEAAEETVERKWIQIELKDDAGQPVAGARYEIKMPDGSIADGTLDARGRARIEGVEPGECEVTFPDFDSREWKKG